MVLFYQLQVPKRSQPILMKIDTNMEKDTKVGINQGPRSFPRHTSINVRGIRSMINPQIQNSQNVTLLVSKTRILELRRSINSLRRAPLTKFLN